MTKFWLGDDIILDENFIRRIFLPSGFTQISWMFYSVWKGIEYWLLIIFLSLKADFHLQRNVK